MKTNRTIDNGIDSFLKFSYQLNNYLNSKFNFKIQLETLKSNVVRGVNREFTL